MAGWGRTDVSAVASFARALADAETLAMLRQRALGVDVQADYTSRTEVAEILAALDHLA